MLEVREQPQKVEKAFLIGVELPSSPIGETELLLDELAELVRNLEIGVGHRMVVNLKVPSPKFYLGSGKAEALMKQAKAMGCDCIVFDHDLTPGQQRNWEQASGLCVIDRQEVILDIFADRAQTKEASLQVELARAEYSLPRLRRAWTHLSRQRGGGVTQRGEGEAQIELDQRMVRQRIARLKRELEEVVQHRAVQRKRRMRVPLPTAAIVGYTNAGKSSLLNRLTGSGVLAANKLFATLDPTTRQLNLPGGQKLLVTDTVGFVRRLPHRLVEAFKATLEEAVVSDFLIHVLDATSPEVQAHRETTLSVLKELGADSKRILTVYNKIDLLPRPGMNGRGADGEKPQVTATASGNGHASDASVDAILSGSRGAEGLFAMDDLTTLQRRDPEAVFVSAHTGEGLEELFTRMELMLEPAEAPLRLLIPHDRYDVIHRLHSAGCVSHEEAGDEGVHIVGNIPPRLRGLVEEFVLSPASA